MNARTGIILVGLLSLVTIAVMRQNVFAQTQVAIHATQAEIDIWNDRRTNGPYQSEWTAIKARADAYKNSPESRWVGYTGAGCYPYQTGPRPSRILDRGMRDAGLVYLMTRDTSYLTVIRDELIKQTTISGTDWTDGTKWCSSNAYVTNYVDIGNWMRRLLYAYSCVRDDLSLSDQNTLDQWFLDAATHFMDGLHNWVSVAFPNRLSDDYSCTGLVCPGSYKGLTHYGGYDVYNFHERWQNIPATGACYIGMAGIMFDNSKLKAHAKRWYQEFIKYAVFPGGVVQDQRRWYGYSPSKPQRGYFYAGTIIGTVITLADLFARSGDTSLYDFSTELGMYGTASPGNPKSLLQVIQHFAGLTNGTVSQYASTTSTSDPDLLIDASGEVQGSNDYIQFVNLAPANIYFKDPDIKTAYTKSLPGSWFCGGYDCLGGDWGSYPAIRFMFGQLENVVWPYPSPDDTPPASPANCSLVGP